MLQVGVIGMGRRMSCGVIPALMRLGEAVRVCTVADPMQEKSREWMRSQNIPMDGVAFYETADEMLANETLDGALIGTRCNLHAQMAEKVMARGIPLFLEKPVFMDEQGKQLLQSAAERQTAPVEVSFPLRMTEPALLAREIVRSGELGRICQVEAINTPNYGRGYFKKWHRQDELSGGLFLQKATHDLDLIFFLTDTQPVKLCAMKTRNVFGGDLPKGLTCDGCDRRAQCPESDFVLERRFMEPQQPHNCVFSKDVEIEDAGSVLVLLSDGSHASYAQCFAARKRAGLRMTRVVGFKATLELEFVSGEVKVFHHQSQRVDTYHFDEAQGHFGGDEGLMRAFVSILRKEPCEYPTLRHGIRSAATCLAAKRSAEEERFVHLEDFIKQAP